MTMTTTGLMTSGSVGAVDERVVAQAALDTAEEQLQSLCASHAGTFVSVERRGRAMEDALKDMQAHIKAVEEKVQNAQQVLEQDEDKETSLAILSEKHRVRRRTLLQHSSLLELLELPSLMDACVRSNLYEEALSIAAFSNTLERRHKDSNIVVTQVISQIRSRQTDLRRHLLHRLKMNVTMPQCLEVVTALRRLNSIDLERQSEANLERVHAAMELRLQVDFLEARDAWLDSNSSASAGKSEELLDAIERYRTRVFEVATQFNAIFRAQTNASESTVSLLSMWTSRRVHSFLNLLALQLAPMEDAASLRDALEASVFFATSMGRLGADFTALLPPLFEPKMHALVVVSWKEGVQQLIETLKVCREAGVATPLVSQGAPEAVQAAEAPLDQPQPPPRQLMALPPLARLVNSILTGLNELRRCLLPGIFSTLRQSLDEVISTVKSELQSNERAVMAPGLRGQAAALRAAAGELNDMFDRIVEPYLRGSLEAAIGNTDGAVRFHTILQENEKEPEPEVEGDEQDPPQEGQNEQGEETNEEIPPTDEDADAPANDADKDEPVVEALQDSENLEHGVEQL